MKDTRDMDRRFWSSREDALNDFEVQQMFEACRDFLDKVVVMVPLFAGMRIGEVQHMSRTWLNWKERVIRIPSHQLCSCYECRDWRHGVWEPKTKHGVRNLLLVPELDFLKDLDGTIGRSRQALEQRFVRIRQRSGITRNCYPHALRATFATKLAEKGISSPALTYLMGWESLTPAENYIQSRMHKAHAEFKELSYLYDESSAKMALRDNGLETVGGSFAGSGSAMSEDSKSLTHYLAKVVDPQPTRGPLIAGMPTELERQFGTAAVAQRTYLSNAWLVEVAVEACAGAGVIASADAPTVPRQSTEEQDTISRFIEDTCDVRPGTRVVSKVLFQAYQRWACENRITALRKYEFNKAVVGKSFEYRNATGNRPTFFGIGLLTHPKAGESAKVTQSLVTVSR